MAISWSLRLEIWLVLQNKNTNNLRPVAVIRNENMKSCAGPCRRPVLAPSAIRPAESVGTWVHMGTYHTWEKWVDINGWFWLLKCCTSSTYSDVVRLDDMYERFDLLSSTYALAYDGYCCGKNIGGKSWYFSSQNWGKTATSLIMVQKMSTNAMRVEMLKLIGLPTYE